MNIEKIMSDSFKIRGSELFKQRKIFSNFLSERGIHDREQRKAFTQFCKDQRAGDYLIKVSRNNRINYHGESNLYIDYSYTADGWFVLNSRKNAQWFTAKEAYEFVGRMRGFAVVKK